MYILPKEFFAKKIFQHSDAIVHSGSVLFFLVNSKQDTGRNKFKGLQERAIRFVVVNSIHLGHKDVGIFLDVSKIVFIGSALKIFVILAFFVDKRSNLLQKE